jgi:hypothetical protein
MSVEAKEPICAWCGSRGGFANRLIIGTDTEGELLAECEWCASTEYFRRKAANGKQDDR